MGSLTRDIHDGPRLKVAMVGGGEGAFFGGIHRAAMRLSDRFEIVSGCFSSDADKSRLAGRALRLDPSRVFATYHDLVADERGRAQPADVALIVTPNAQHYAPCRQFLDAGIPVICEKPLVNSVAEARDLEQCAGLSGLMLGVTYTYQGYPMVRDARARIRDGEIGEVRFLYVEYLLDWLAGDPALLGKGGVWRGDPAVVGRTAALGDVGTHAFNLLEFVSGLNCTALHARLRSTVPGFVLDDSASVQLEFAGGAEGLLWCSLAAPGHRNGLRFRIVGTLGTLEWQQELPETLSLARLDRADLTYRRGQSDITADGRASTSLPAGSPEGYIGALAILYRDFATALAEGRQWRHATSVPVPDVHQGARGVLLSEACLASHAARRWVSFDEQLLPLDDPIGVSQP